jgi:hypothetical protein
MKKVFAIILLIPVLTLFAGSVTLASSCAKMAAAAECGGISKAPQKCTMTSTHQECKRCMDGGGQKSNKGQTGKGEQNGKNGGSCCVDCPLCCLVTFKPFFRWEIARQVTMIDYTVMSDNNLGDYFQPHWKPPCGSFLS